MKRKEQKSAYIVENYISKIKDVTLDKKDDINEMRIMYENLNDEQKNLVKNINLLDNAERIILQLEKKSGSVADKYVAKCIDEQFDLSYNVVNSQILLDLKRETMAYCISLYEKITDEQRYNVKNYAKLEEIIKILKRLEEIEYNKSLAKEVIKIIELLPENVVLSDEKQINEAYEVYLSLNDEAKEYVSNYYILDNDLSIIEDIKAAMVVVALIDELKSFVSLDDKEEIDNANNAYEGLSIEEKQYVTNYAKLEEINKAIMELLQTEKDKKCAKNMDNQIQLTYNIVFNEETNLDIKKEQYQACMVLYENITKAQKDFMEKEVLLNPIVLHLEELDILANKKSKAMYVYNLIKEIPFHIVVETKESLIFVENEYKKLDETEKGFVTNYEVLEKALVILETKIKAQKVIDLINSLDNEFSVEKVNDVERYYNNLENEAKNHVNNYNKLSMYIKNMKSHELNVTKAKTLNIEIESFTLKALDDEQCVLLFRSSYEDLVTNVKGYVTNYEKLISMEKSIMKMKVAKEMDEMIELLNGVELTKNIDNIISLKKEFDELDAETKANLHKGEIMKNIYEKAIEIRNSVNEVIDAIEVIGTVTIDEKDDIARCRLAYELLDDDLQVLVSNYETLLDNEREAIKLQSNFEYEKGYIHTYLDEQILLLDELIKDEMIDLEKKKEYIAIIKQSYEKMDNKESVQYFHRVEEIEGRMVA